jgi:hypothetical protein
LRNVSTVAAYRDRWHITGQSSIGSRGDVGSTEQMSERKRAQAAVERALGMSRDSKAKQTSDNLDPQIALTRGIER